MIEGDGRRAPGRGFSRRAIVASAALPLLGGCGGNDRRPSSPTRVPFAGSPVAQVAGYDEPTKWSGQSLRIGAWGGEIQLALRDRIWNPFERLTGCVVQEVTTDYGQLAASLAGSDGPYADVLLVDALWASGALSRNDVEPIPADAIDPSAFAVVQLIDGAVPAYAYAMVSAFRRDAVERAGPPTTWAEWWDPVTHAGARALPKGPLGSFEFALLADGVPRDRLYPLDGARAIEKLRQISGEIVDRWWETGDQPVVWLSNDRARYAAAWHYRVIASQQDGRPIDFVWDDALLVADHWVIARGTPALDVALDFLAFATTPEVQASLADSVPLGPVVEGAFALIDPRTAGNLPTSPETRERLISVDAAWWASNEVDANERFNSWLLGVPMIES
ncbi:MAG: extracellular solute-binding protein [Thermomicrobiales bacterium]|nr:extracellular solute-binding protein [Thermomicrobiales bacterium]